MGDRMGARLTRDCELETLRVAAKLDPARTKEPAF
jgi:hypothetical protein